MNVNYEQVSSSLRKAIKVNGLTYKSLGKKIGMTESGVKKVLNGKDCSLSRLTQICSVMNLSLKDVLNESSKMKVVEIDYSEAQEHFFSTNENYFLFYWELRNHNYEINIVQKKYKLDDKSTEKYLLALDRLNLIELHPGPKVIPVIEKADRKNWMANSPFSKKMIMKFKVGLYNHSLKNRDEAKSKVDMLHQMNIMEIRPETFKEFNIALMKTIRTFTERVHQEKSFSKPEELIPIGTLAITSPFQFSDVISIPNLTE